MILGCFAATESKSIGSVLTSPGTLQGLSQFISTVKSLFGTGGDFAKRYGYSYNDIYNSQLMYQAVNSYSNDRQVEQEAKQEETMEKDLNQEMWYFNILAVFTGISMIVLIITMLLKFSEILWTKSSRTKNKIIEQYVAEQELKQLAGGI